jgi:hypothetical protein
MRPGADPILAAPTYAEHMTTHDRSPSDSSRVEALFEASPAPEVRTSAVALVAFVCGIGALVAAPFSITFGLALALAALSSLSAVVALATTSRPHVAGEALAPAGLFFSLVTLTVLGLRFANLDTAFGDELGSELTQLLERLNSLVHAPGPVER